MNRPRKLEWYEHIPTLMTETDKLYERIVAKWPEKTKRNQTAKKMVELRAWKPSLRLITKNFCVLDELNVAYIPKVMVPGPCFLFPLHDVDRTYPYAQVKPLPGSVIQTKAKYHFMGTKPIGPQWMGITRSTTAQIIQTRRVVVVEGAFDCIACRLLCPDVPVLSPLTKKLGAKHVIFLRILGVKDLYLMYDNEASGQGNKAMEVEAQTLSKHFNVHVLLCPASDPSEALKSATVAGKLKRMLSNVGTPKAQQDAVLEFEL
jgi:hypothetical protein